MFQAAMISKWHVHAKDYAGMLQERPDVKITCVWDEDADRGRDWAAELGAEFVPEYDDLLRRNDVDGVVIDSPTSMHRELILKASEAKKHIYTEKVLAPTVRECREIADAVSRSGVVFCISLPQRTTPAYLYIKKLVEDGALGKIVSGRFRNGHDGAVADWLPAYWYGKREACGGVLLDLGCHPVYLSRWMLGEPESVTSSFSSLTGREVEDNAVCIARFRNGACAVLESSFDAPGTPYMLELYGTRGCVLAVGEKVQVKLPDYGNGNGWYVPDQELPKPGRSAICQWVEGCTAGIPVEFGMEAAVQLTEMMEAAYRSDDQKRTIRISECS